MHLSKIFEVGIADSLREHIKHSSVDIIDKAGSCITAELASIYELVMGVIDVNRTKEKGYETIVKEGFCEELDELRQIYEELLEFLEQVSSLELARLPQLHGNKHAPAIIIKLVSS
ncbi:MutS protein msh5 [Ancistrocladus abbreviatus]